MYRYGFELEGFYLGTDNAVSIPPVDLPSDGFPGLVELRTTGGKSLQSAYAELIREYLSNKEEGIEEVSFALWDHKFDGAQMASLRRHRSFSKDIVDVNNIYGKSPRRLGNVTLASFQINISNVVYEESKRTYYDKDGKECSITLPTRYGIVDTARIVKALDSEFANEIAASKRQPGMYSIKDSGIRLEYRSLPNSVFTFDARRATTLLNRIEKCIDPE